MNANSSCSAASTTQDKMSQQIPVLDPIVPVTTNGRPNVVTRIKLSIEVAMDKKKQRTCGYCKEKGHYSSGCKLKHFICVEHVVAQVVHPIPIYGLLLVWLLHASGPSRTASTRDLTSASILALISNPVSVSVSSGGELTCCSQITSPQSMYVDQMDHQRVGRIIGSLI
ncbi:hypothetical protein Tco_0865323 [Tanacetum coccineum]